MERERYTNTNAQRADRGGQVERSLQLRTLPKKESQLRAPCFSTAISGSGEKPHTAWKTRNGTDVSFCCDQIQRQQQRKEKDVAQSLSAIKIIRAGDSCTGTDTGKL